MTRKNRPAETVGKVGTRRVRLNPASSILHLPETKQGQALAQLLAGQEAKSIPLARLNGDQIDSLVALLQNIRQAMEPPKESPAVKALVDYGVWEPVANKLAQEAWVNEERVKEVIAYTETTTIQNKPGFVVSCLRKRSYPTERLPCGYVAGGKYMDEIER